MAPNDIDFHLLNWADGFKRVYKYWSMSFITEYVVLEKVNDNEFKCDRTNSTIDFGTKNKDELIKLLGSNVLIYFETFSAFSHYEMYKTRGCICGAWATVNKNCHAHWCVLYK